MKIEEMTKRKNWIDDHFPTVGRALDNLDSAYAAYVSDVYRELTDVYRELTAATQRAEAAEAANARCREDNILLCNSRNAAAEEWRVRAEAAEAKLTLVERYGADQWRRGNAGKEPQEFNEWQRDLEEWRQSERAAQRSEVQP
jgi:hypothetical protein